MDPSGRRPPPGAEKTSDMKAPDVQITTGLDRAVPSSVFAATTISRGNGASGSTAAHRGEQARRLLNVAVATFLLILAAPFMIVIALLIKFTSSGPILYRQPRIGLNRRNGGDSPPGRRRQIDLGGRPFRIYKFRTMRIHDADWDDAVWAQPNDPRVTPIGRILRKYRLDELPQLFNILWGDMNLVGPRPEQPRIFDQLRGWIVAYEARQLVRPGITGWAQVNQHYDRSLEDVQKKVTLDLEYIERQSVTEDLRIMLRTIPVVLFRRGAW